MFDKNEGKNTQIKMEGKVEEKVRDHDCLQHIQHFHCSACSSNWKMFQTSEVCQCLVSSGLQDCLISANAKYR